MQMGKRARASKLSDSHEDALSKLSKKQRSLAVSGVPDESDVHNLNILFETYDKVTGGKLRKFLDEIRLERALNNRDADEVSVDKAENLAFAMPQDLQEEVEKYWPTLWTNPDHLRWFLKKFPKFRR
jgi:hypothetical protein